MSKYYHILIVCAALFFLISHAGANVAAAESTPAEKLLTAVPDDVLGLVATSGGDSVKPAFKKAILGQMWYHPQVQTFYQSIRKELLPKLKQEMHDPDAAKGLDIALDFAKLALSRPIIVGVAQKKTTQGPPAYGFAILDAGQRKAEIASSLTKLEALAGEDEIIEINVGSFKMHGPRDADEVPGYWG